MRPELNKKNAEKVYEMVNKIRDEHGIDMTPNSLVNFIIETVETVDVTRIVKIGMAIEPPPSPDGKKQKTQRVKSTKTTNWVTEF